jgi:hypothetical protein
MTIKHRVAINRMTGSGFRVAVEGPRGVTRWHQFEAATLDHYLRMWAMRQDVKVDASEPARRLLERAA